MTSMAITNADSLEGPSLLWAVAVAEGFRPRLVDGALTGLTDRKESFAFLTRLDQAKPILDREEIYMVPQDNGLWSAHCTKRKQDIWNAPSGLVAAMRCHVAMALGPDIMVPVALLPETTAPAPEMPRRKPGRRP